MTKCQGGQEYHKRIKKKEG